MKPILILQHVHDDGPGYFAAWLDRAGLSFQVVHLHLGQAIPDDIGAYAGLCILGGPMSANDGLPYQAAQMALIRDAVAMDIPVIGHCLGGQLMSKALGGTVGASENVEIGWCNLRLDATEAQDWFGGREAFQLFQWHGESFSIPPGGERIATGDYCANQAFVVGQKHLGMQFHCEVDEDKVRTWIINGHDELIRCVAPSVQQAGQLLPDLPAMIAQSQRVADDIYARWAKGLVQ